MTIQPTTAQPEPSGKGRKVATTSQDLDKIGKLIAGTIEKQRREEHRTKKELERLPNILMTRAPALTQMFLQGFMASDIPDADKEYVRSKFEVLRSHRKDR